MRVVIIGNGISGITAARHIRKNNAAAEIVVISSESKYFFSRTALMYIYMGHMQLEHTQPYESWFWEKNRIELIFDHVEQVETSAKKLRLRSGESMAYDILIIASGSKSNFFGWTGQDLKGVQGLYSLQDLQNLEALTPLGNSEKRVKRAVLVGGGLIGIELAEMLISRGIQVTFMIRESHFWGNILPKEESELVSRHIREHGVDLKFHTELKEIVGDENADVRSIITMNNEELECEFVGISAGVSPNIAFLKDSGIETARGVLVDSYLRTNIPDVYSIGDCVQFRIAPPGRKTIEQVWYTGRMMGETLANTICGNAEKYEPGPWFNSAKFFDIEYQTYGEVPAQQPADWGQFYWEHPQGKIALKIVFSKSDNTFRGINLLGMRMRHEVFDRWLRQDKKCDYVMSHLRDAWFDPEFSRDFFDQIMTKYNRDFNQNLDAKKKNWFRILERNEARKS